MAAWLRDGTALTSIVLWGPAGADWHGGGRRVAGAARLAPPTRIGDLLALARGARLMVSGDTGPLHLAAAVGTPIVGLFGPTSPSAMVLARDDVVVSRNRECECHHQRRCRRGRVPCIERISIEEVRGRHRAAASGR